MALVMKANGMMISNMVKELKFGQTTLVTKDNTKMERSMDLESLFGLTSPLSKVNSPIIIYMARVFTLGTMVANMTETGLTTKWMVKEYLRGSMEEYTKDSISRIRNMDMVNLNGQTDVVIKVVGLTAASTAKEYISTLEVNKDKENGSTEKELGGSTIDLQLF